MMLQGMTAQYLIRRTHRVQAGETVVVHAAAGGVGLILCQWIKHLGATVIGVVSTEAKADLAREHGAAHVVVGHENLPAEVKRITGGAMVPVIYDSVGKDTFTLSLDSLAPLGLMVSYGNASGPVPPIEIATLGAKGSLFLTPAQPGHLHRQGHRPAGLRQGPVRRRPLRRRQDPRQPDLPPRRRPSRPRGPRSQKDDGQHRPDPVTVRGTPMVNTTLE